MRRAALWVTTALVLANVVGACRSDDIPSSCNEARLEMEKDIRGACSSLDLASTGYCSTCVLGNFYSYRKANSEGVCQCTPLDFSADFCAQQRNEEKLRSAIKFANDDCARFELPSDGGTDAAPDAADADTKEEDVAAATPTDASTDGG